MRQKIANAVGYQAVWFIAVLSAAAGLAWPGIAAAALFVALQPAGPRGRRADVALYGAALLAGLGLDGGLAGAGLLDYAAASAWSPAPLWILAIWVAFAATLERSLAFLQTRPLAATLLGAIGGPLAYLAAARLGAVALAEPSTPALLALSVGWAVLMPSLAWLSARHRPRVAAVSPGGGR